MSLQKLVCKIFWIACVIHPLTIKFAQSDIYIYIFHEFPFSFVTYFTIELEWLMLFRGWICVSLFSQKLHFLIYIISQLTPNYFFYFLQNPHKMNTIWKDWKLVWRYVPNFIIFSIFFHKLCIFPDIFSKLLKLSL